jgi:hypothetical protein
VKLLLIVYILKKVKVHFNVNYSLKSLKHTLDLTSSQGDLIIGWDWWNYMTIKT